MNKVAIESRGCSKNLNDSEIMAGILESSGYSLTENFEEADIIIVNTCGFIDSAKEESINTILEMASFKETGKLKYLVVAGCLAQRYSGELEKEIPEIDAIVGTTSFPMIVNIIKGLEIENKLTLIEHIDKDIDENLPKKKMTPKHMAYLKIAEGCDNKCTYCIIPKLRGKYRSRKVEDILHEAKILLDGGVKELILIAQDTSRYGIDLYKEKKLPHLLEKLSDMGFEWIRIMYTYPEEIDENLVKVMASRKNICSYFDMPIQHASDRVLKLMNRKTTQQNIMEKIQMIRAHMPEATIRTTLIVGFPGETQKDFNELKEFVGKVKFDRLGAFAYSKEEGTAAANLGGHMEDEMKEARRDEIMILQQGISMDKNMAKIGETVSVLIEEELEDGVYLGRTCSDAPEIDGAVYVNAKTKLDIGSFVSVNITGAAEYDLVGDII